jgi:hypothetical protein
MQRTYLKRELTYDTYKRYLGIGAAEQLKFIHV